jgi:hypothetical protein
LAILEEQPQRRALGLERIRAFPIGDVLLEPGGCQFIGAAVQILQTFNPVGLVCPGRDERLYRKKSSYCVSSTICQGFTPPLFLAHLDGESLHLAGEI